MSPTLQQCKRSVLGLQLCSTASYFTTTIVAADYSLASNWLTQTDIRRVRTTNLGHTNITRWIYTLSLPQNLGMKSKKPQKPYETAVAEYRQTAPFGLRHRGATRTDPPRSSDTRYFTPPSRQLAVQSRNRRFDQAKDSTLHDIRASKQTAFRPIQSSSTTHTFIQLLRYRCFSQLPDESRQTRRYASSIILSYSASQERVCWSIGRRRSRTVRGERCTSHSRLARLTPTFGDLEAGDPFVLREDADTRNSHAPGSGYTYSDRGGIDGGHT